MKGLTRILSLAAVVYAASACNGKPQPPAPGVPFGEASLKPNGQRTQPNLCAGDSKGKKFSVAGYAQWADGLVSGPNPLGSGKVAFLKLVPKPDADADGEWVGFRMPIRGGIFGGEGIEEPKMENANTSTKGVGRGAKSETTGSVSDDTIQIHLPGGATATNKTKLRVSLEVEGGNGSCNLVYVSAIEET